MNPRFQGPHFPQKPRCQLLRVDTCQRGDVHLRCFSNGSHLLPLPSWFGDDVVAPKAFLPARPMVGSFAWFRPLSLHTPWTPLVLLGWPPQNRSKTRPLTLIILFRVEVGRDGKTHLGMGYWMPSLLLFCQVHQISSIDFPPSLSSVSSQFLPSLLPAAGPTYRTRHGSLRAVTSLLISGSHAAHPTAWQPYRIQTTPAHPVAIVVGGFAVRRPCHHALRRTAEVLPRP